MVKFPVIDGEGPSEPVMSLETVVRTLESSALHFGGTRVFVVIDGQMSEIASIEFSAAENCVYLKAAE